MDFSLGEEQSALQIMVHKFREREIDPVARDIDKDGKLPDDLIHKMARVGLLGIAAPKAYGGNQAGKFNAVLACEQIAYSGTGAWWLVAFANSVADCIARFGSEALKEWTIPLICDGTAYPSVQFTEDETGSDPQALTMTALPHDDHYLLNGVKRFSSFGARTGLTVVYAKDERGECTVFAARKDVPGYSVSKLWDLLGGGGMEAADVHYHDVQVPATSILGQKGKGFDVLLYWIAVEKIEQCAASIGIGQAALDEAVNYAKTRRARGKPISSMQGIRWMVAEINSLLQAARLMTYRAAWLADHDAPNWITEAAAAKLFVVPTIIEITEIARQIHGAYGYTKDLKIEMLSRAAGGAAGIATSLEINKSLVGAALVR